MKERLESILCHEFVLFSIDENLEELFSLIPELRLMVNFDQNNPAHDKDLWNHTLYALALSKNDFEIRLSLLLHDLGKVTCNYTGEDNITHYKGHPLDSFKISESILKRLDFSQKEQARILYLIIHHDDPIETELNELERKRLHIQYCDLYAHDRKYIEQRRNYIGQMTRKLELK